MKLPSYAIRSNGTLHAAFICGLIHSRWHHAQTNNCIAMILPSDLSSPLANMIFTRFVCMLAMAVLCPSAITANGGRIGLPFTRRNLGGPLKDWYLMKMTKNYFCTDTGRVIPVDPETGHMLLKGLRKRSSIDDFFHTSHATEHGICKDGKLSLLVFCRIAWH